IDEFKWGNEEIVLKLLKKTINREGIGDLIADGTRIMAEKLGVDPELAAHVKGLEVPMHDPRAYLGQALSYMTGCVGANHCKGDFYLVEGKMLTYKKIKAGDRFDINGREESVINMQDIANIYDSAVICGTPKINEALLCKILKAVTGFSSVSSAKKMYLVGKRAFILKRVISGKLGSKREDDYLKKINSVALDNGGAAGISVDLEENLKKYYEIRGLDWNTGLPTKETLEKLGI
ncbi:MAG: hypothetical protein GY870_14260, partial [archaeon]|nr:hypothetical protein [archaeon]